MWRGPAVPKATPADIVQTLGEAARKAADDAVFRDALSKASLGWADADAAAFRTVIDKGRPSVPRWCPSSS